MSELSIALKKIREEKGFTIEKLAEKAGLGKGTIGDIETGRRNGSRKSLEKISVALGLTKKEKTDLFSYLLPEEIRKSMKAMEPMYSALDSRGKRQLNDIVKESTLMFNDETIPEEDKEKVLMAIQSAFFIAKEKNKRKK